MSLAAKPLFIHLEEWVVDILMSNELTESERRVFWYLFKLDRYGSRFVDLPSQKEMAIALNLSTRSIRRAIIKLEEMGLFDFKIFRWQGRNLAGYYNRETPREISRETPQEPPVIMDKIVQLQANDLTNCCEMSAAMTELSTITHANPCVESVSDSLTIFNESYKNLSNDPTHPPESERFLINEFSDIKNLVENVQTEISIEVGKESLQQVTNQVDQLDQPNRFGQFGSTNQSDQSDQDDQKPQNSKVTNFRGRKNSKTQGQTFQPNSDSSSVAPETHESKNDILDWLTKHFTAKGGYSNPRAYARTCLHKPEDFEYWRDQYLDDRQRRDRNAAILAERFNDQEPQPLRAMEQHRLANTGDCRQPALRLVSAPAPIVPKRTVGTELARINDVLGNLGDTDNATTKRIREIMIGRIVDNPNFVLVNGLAQLVAGVDPEQPLTNY